MDKWTALLHLVSFMSDVTFSSTYPPTPVTFSWNPPSSIIQLPLNSFKWLHPLYHQIHHYRKTSSTNATQYFSYSNWCLQWRVLL